MSKLLTREAILAAPDVEHKELDIPEWGGSVVIRALTKAAEKAIRREAQLPDGTPDTEKLEMLFFVYGVIEPKFSLDDVPALEERSAGVIDRVLTQILSLSGLSPEAVKTAEETFRSGSGA